MHSPDEFLRAALAEEAARQILRGHSPAALYPGLRRQTTAELLARAQHPLPCTRSVALRAALTSLLCTVQLAVRRRPGWLQVEGLRDIPADFALSAQLPLLQAALLCFLRDCLRGGTAATVQCQCIRGTVLLRLHGPHHRCDEDTAALLSALAKACGGVLLLNVSPGFTAVLRLPASSAASCAPAYPRGESDLLRDRFSPLYLYLYELCADPWQ